MDLLEVFDGKPAASARAYSSSIKSACFASESQLVRSAPGRRTTTDNRLSAGFLVQGPGSAQMQTMYLAWRSHPRMHILSFLEQIGRFA